MEINDKLLESRLRGHMGETSAVGAALSLARKIHEGQMRDEGTPYIAHPLRVALILVEEAGVMEPELAVAALLHDALEDGPSQSAAGIEAAFGQRVARLVVCLTDEFKRTDLPRERRKQLYLERVAGECDDCLVLKLCDRIDNLRSLCASPVPGKAELIRMETRAYLIPGLAGRRSPALARLARLLEDALP